MSVNSIVIVLLAHIMKKHMQENSNNNTASVAVPLECNQRRYNEVGTDGESLNAPPRQQGDNKPPDEPHTLESDARQGSVANGRQHTTPAYTLGD